MPKRLAVTVLLALVMGSCTKAPEDTSETSSVPSPAANVDVAAQQGPAPAAAQGPFAGTIDESGYHPPAGASVQWKRPGAATVTKSLNPAISWNGQSAGNDAGYFGRYAGGDPSVRGAQIAAIGSEQKGGEASDILTQLLGRPPSNQELYDFATSNSPGAPMGCSHWVQFTGAPRPGCVDTGPGGSGRDKLRPRPTDPLGCCPRDLWCTVNDPVRDVNRKKDEHWIEPVNDPVRGRMACNLVKSGSTDTGTPTVTPTVTPEKPNCWLLRVPQSGQPTLTKVTCPP
jgi:hypothetical protein